MLSWFSSWTGSYALALLLYALIFKLLFLFFSIKQQKTPTAPAPSLSATIASAGTREPCPKPSNKQRKKQTQ